MIRIAAVGDLHYGTGSTNLLRPQLAQLPGRADLLVLAGDLTRCGSPDEIRVLADDLRTVSVPVVAVLGNHDYEADLEDEVREVLEQAEVRVLEGEAVTLDIDGARVGIAGTKGFGGGFRGAHGTDFGEPEMKAFVGHTKKLANSLERSLQGLDADYRVALLHYAPIEATLEGERLEIYPFLGSYLLAEAIDNAGADIVFHGHAHNGSEKGRTPAGIPVRNVAQPVIRHAYNVYTLGAAASLARPVAAEDQSGALPATSRSGG